MLPLVLVIALLAAQVVLAPPAFLVTGLGGGSASIWESFKEGGWGMWAVTLLDLLLAPGIFLLGMFTIRGKRVPAAIAFTLGLGPFAVGVLAALAGQRMISEVLGSELIDPSQRARIFAMGISEIMNVTNYGASAAAVASYAAAMAAVLGVVSIAPAPLGPAPKSIGWMLSLPAGLAAVILAFAVRSATGVTLLALDILVLFGLLTSGLLAALAGQVLPALVASRNDDGEAGRAFRLLAAAAFGFAAAMVFADRAALAAGLRAPLGAVAGSGVDPSQRATILAAAVLVEMKGRPLVMLADAAACVLVFVPPLAAATRAKGKVSIASGFGVVAAALVAGLALAAGASLDRELRSLRAPFDAIDQAIASNGIDLPVARGGDTSRVLDGTSVLLVTRDGAALSSGGALPGPVEEDEEQLFAHEQRATAVAADAALPVELFMSKAAPVVLGSSGAALVDLVERPATRAKHEDLGPFAGLMGSDLRVLRVGIAPLLGGGLPGAPHQRLGGSHVGRSTLALALVVDGGRARMLLLSRARPALPGTPVPEVLPLGESEAAERRRTLRAVHDRNPDLGTMVLVLSKGDTMGRVCALLEMLAEAQLEPRDDVVLTLDRPQERDPLGF